MVRFGGRGIRLPDAVRSGLALQRGEKVLAGDALADGAWAVATDRRLLLIEDDGRRRLDRGWFEVDSAAWDGESGVLAVNWVTGERTWLAQTDTESVRMATVLRERVESSVVARERVDVRGRGGASVVARRIGSRLVAQVVPDRGTDLDDPEVAEALRRARSNLTDLVGPLDDA